MSIYNGTPEPEPSISAAEFMRQAKEQKRLRQEQEQEYPIVHGDNWGEYELKQQRRQKRKRLIVVSAVIAGSLALGFVGGSFVKRYQLVPTGKNGSAYLSDRLTGKSWLVHGGAMREVLSGEALEKAEKAKRDERARQDARIEAEYAAERAARQAREDADKVERAREYAANVAREKEQAAKERAQKIAEFNAVVRDPHTAVIDKFTLIQKPMRVYSVKEMVPEFPLAIATATLFTLTNMVIRKLLSGMRPLKIGFQSLNILT